MLDLIYDFIDSDLWDLSMAAALSGGISALIALLLPIGPRPRKAMIVAGLGLLAGSIVFSMVFEDLLPTLSTLPEHRRLPYALAFPLYLIAVSMIVYGGWLFVRSSLVVLQGFGRSGQGGLPSGYLFTPKDQRLPAGELLRLWLPGLSWLAAGFALIFVAASMQHEHHFPLGWLWALFGAGA